MRYLIYLRVSTEKQEDSGLGLEAQRYACYQWIERHGGGIALEYIDIVTGTDRKRKELEQRPNLMEALRHLNAGDVFLVAKRDRLGRDPYVNCMVERMIEKKQCRLVSANGEMDGAEPQDILMRRIIDAFAEYEALLISMRTKAALSRKKAKGDRLGKVPYGQRLNAKGVVVTDPNEAQILQLMYTYRVRDKLTFREIASRLNEQGLYNRPTKRLSHIPWTHGATARVYENHLKQQQLQEAAP
jgi:DNA invertase Pin-like site-specific DNA recombinase